MWIGLLPYFEAVGDLHNLSSGQALLMNMRSPHYKREIERTSGRDPGTPMDPAGDRAGAAVLHPFGQADIFQLHGG